MPARPDRDAFTPPERALVGRLRTPLQVQRFLRSLPYNWGAGGETLRTFRGVVQHGAANCIEAALTAAAILEQHGYPPLLLDLESVDELDHVLFLFRAGGRWGTVGKSRDAGLHGRRPVFRSVRDLVSSYLEPYVDLTGRIKGYGVAHLDELVPRCDWRLAPHNVWVVEQRLITMAHRRHGLSAARYTRVRDRYAAFRARCPKQPARYFAGRDRWW
jgi:hypothetical protein